MIEKGIETIKEINDLKAKETQEEIEYDLKLESYKVRKDFQNEDEYIYYSKQRKERQESLIYQILKHDSEIYRYEEYREKEYKRIYTKEKYPHPVFPFCKCSFRATIYSKLVERRGLEEKMTPEEKLRIREMPEVSKTDERLIFIRRQGINDWQNRIFDVSPIVNSLPKEPLKNLSREEVLNYVHFLENCAREMKAYIHGHEKGYIEEVEPEVIAKNKEREKKEKSQKKVNKTVKKVKKSDSLEEILAARGINAAEFMAGLLALKMQKGEKG